MKTFHIVYYINENDFYSTGKDYKAENSVKALTSFLEEFPDYIFAAMYIRENPYI